jgi:hypothetical protein
MVIAQERTLLIFLLPFLPLTKLKAALKGKLLSDDNVTTILRNYACTG